jgi:hypothetical protein
VIFNSVLQVGYFQQRWPRCRRCGRSLFGLHFAVAKGELLTAEYMQAIIGRADATKVQKGVDRLAQKKIEMIQTEPCTAKDSRSKRVMFLPARLNQGEIRGDRATADAVTDCDHIRSFDELSSPFVT